MSGETVLAPLDDDYDAMRREIWLTTDTAYKRAITMFARKKAVFQNRTASDPIPGFFRRSRRSRRSSRGPPDAARAGADARTVPISCARAAVVGGVRAHPDIDLSEVVDRAGPRHAVLPQQRRLQDCRADSDHVARRCTGKRRQATACRCGRRSATSAARSPICRRPPISSRARSRSPRRSTPRAWRLSAKSLPGPS